MEVLEKSCYFSDGFLIISDQYDPGACKLSPTKFYEFGPFRFDASARVLYRDGERASLSPKAAELLLQLIEAKGNVISKDDLLKAVWLDSFVEEGSLTSHISHLRKTLGETDQGPVYIETIPKRGYRFTAPVKVVDSSDSRAPAPSEKTNGNPIRAKRTIFWIGTVGIGAVVVLAGLLAWQRYGHANQGRIMLVVLPVQNLTGDSARDYLSDGLTDEIIAQLARFNPSRLGVIARTSSFAYKDTKKTVGEIGRELGVDYVLESSLRSVGDQLRINSQLIRVRDQTPVWSARYDQGLRELFTLQEDVPQGIALKIGVELASGGGPIGARTLSPDAYLAYLEGIYYWNKRSPEALERALVHFKQAIQLDPGYALAYAGLANTYASQCLIADVRSNEVFPKAREAALKALALDGALAEAHTSLAYVRLWYEWDWAGAEEAFKKAISLNPGYATAHQWYGEYLRLMGREEEAIAEGKKALELDPLSLIINMEAGLPYYLEGRYDEAMKYFQKTVDMDPNFGVAYCEIGWVQEQQGKYDEAIATFRKGLQLDDSSFILSALGHAYAMAGRKADAQKVLKHLRARVQRGTASSFALAGVLVALHENEAAVEAIEQAYVDHYWGLVWLKVAPNLSVLHTEPRVAALMQQMKFPI
jgi:TolB-like protein/DNA-binding winged helix-turn-helix (wHTH) protein/Tfp pilus assembly protein PilF